MTVVERLRIVRTAESEVGSRFLAFARSELDRAYRLAGLLLSDAGEAEDAVGDSLERAWRNLDRVREPADFRAWFYQILVNNCRDRMRRRRIVRFVALEGADEVAGEDQFQAVLDRHQVGSLLDVLPPDERAIVILHYWADLRLEDVAKRLGWPTGTVKSRLHRALRRLRADIEISKSEVST